MNLTPGWIELFKKSDLDAIHWSSVGSANAPDSEIIAYAVANHLVILTHDLDFGITLITNNQSRPSVVQIRGEDIRPASIGKLVIQTLIQMQTELENGALVTIDANRARLRILSLN